MLALAPAMGQSGLQQSHIDGNVPPPGDFDRLLNRDLLAFFRSSGLSATTVQWKLLRDGPTQTGISFPKFYAWIKVLDATVLLRQGAVRLAAIDRARFEVTTFLSAEQVRTDPEATGKVFPAPLVAEIQAKAMQSH
jgi:hypothetical protein